MIVQYPWFRASRGQMEMITVPLFGFDGVPAHYEQYLRWHGMPPRFVCIDRRLLAEGTRDIDAPDGWGAGARFRLIDVPYVVLREAWLPRDGYWAARADTWYARLFPLFDRCWYAIADGECRLLRCCYRRGWMVRNQFFVQGWRDLKCLGWLRRIQTRRFERACGRMGVVVRRKSDEDG